MTKLTTHVLDIYSGKPGKGSRRDPGGLCRTADRRPALRAGPFPLRRLRPVRGRGGRAGSAAVAVPLLPEAA